MDTTTTSRAPVTPSPQPSNSFQPHNWCTASHQTQGPSLQGKPGRAKVEPASSGTYREFIPEDHVRVDRLQDVCGERIHVFQRQDLKRHQASLILSEEKNQPKKININQTKKKLTSQRQDAALARNGGHVCMEPAQHFLTYIFMGDFARQRRQGNSSYQPAGN